MVGVEGPNGGTIFAGTTCRDGTLVGAGALLAAADADLRAIISNALTPGCLMAPGLSGFIDALPTQWSFMEKRVAPADWSTTVTRLDQEFPRRFAEELSDVWARFDIVYSYIRDVGPVRPMAQGYGWKARVSRPDAEGFLWIRGSKTEAGVARLIGDGPDEESARGLLAIGRRLLDS